MHNLNKHYDYIITGAGCAGLSLLMRLLQEPLLNNKQILVIDQEQKSKNDRTWCFWEKGVGLFETIVHHRWNEAYFIANNLNKRLALTPYTYKMIQGIDFYNYVQSKAASYANVNFYYGKVQQIDTQHNKAVVMVNNETFTADWVFNSILFEKPTIQPNDYYLLQHFKGWVIETTEPSFNPAVATFMDFSISQQQGTSFMYVMPTSTTTALVEYTLFTEQLLPTEAYTSALEEYINQRLGVSSYTIQHEEFGIIPMTNFHFSQQQGRVVYIGIAGGQAKGSSGYAFQFIQKRTQQIINGLLQHTTNFIDNSLAKRKFTFYDAVLLQVLQQKRMPGSEVFAAIFKANSATTVLQFLDNETNLLQDLRIMASVPTKVFLPAAFRQMFK